jgi:aldehyde dehydrogenase (NAD+)
MSTVQEMTAVQRVPDARLAFLDGKTKRLLIDGRWVEAASGRTFETRNPATGEVLAQIAEGDAEDINRAVAAARRAFEGPWSRAKPFERQALLLKLAELVDRNFEELSTLDTLDMGAPISRTRNNRLRALGMLHYYAGQAVSILGESMETSLPGEYFTCTLKEPVGVVGAIIPLERTAGGDDLENRPGACHRLRRGPQAGRGGAAHGAAPRRAVPRGRRAARSCQYRAGPR